VFDLVTVIVLIQVFVAKRMSLNNILLPLAEFNQPLDYDSLKTINIIVYRG